MISFDMEVDSNASNTPEDNGTMTQNCLELIEYINESGLLKVHDISEIELWETLDENNFFVINLLLFCVIFRKKIKIAKV